MYTIALKRKYVFARAPRNWFRGMDGVAKQVRRADTRPRSALRWNYRRVPSARPPSHITYMYI